MYIVCLLFSGVRFDVILTLASSRFSSSKLTLYISCIYSSTKSTLRCSYYFQFKYRRAMCALELLVLKRDILFVTSNDFSAKDISAVIHSMYSLHFACSFMCFVKDFIIVVGYTSSMLFL